MVVEEGNFHLSSHLFSIDDNECLKLPCSFVNCGCLSSKQQLQYDIPVEQKTPTSLTRYQKDKLMLVDVLLNL